MMPLLGSTTALSVYTVSAPSAITPEKLAQYAFRSIDELPEERGWGWVNIEDMFDTEWRVSPAEMGGYMCFSLRVDTRKVSSAVLKKHLSDALREEEGKAAAEGRKVPRGRKKELKEILLAKLQSQTEPVPSSIDVIVDMDSGQILVSSVSTAQIELFEEYFAASFGLKPERFLIDAADGQKLLASIHESGLSPSFDGHAWQLEQASQASLMHPETGATVNTKDEPEAVSRALAAGLVFTRLQCRLFRQDDESLEWTFTLGAEGVITGLKTPKVERPDDDSADGALLEKIYLLEQAVGVLKELTRP